MLVDFSVIPIGGGVSLSDEVAKVIRLIDESGLPYKLNPMGTVVEGEWHEIMALIEKCHNLVLADQERVLTSIVIDDRKGKVDMIEKKVESVKKKLGWAPTGA